MRVGIPKTLVRLVRLELLLDDHYHWEVTIERSALLAVVEMRRLEQ